MLRTMDTLWADGCFDLTHYGHFNALRQSRLLGQCLVCGVHSDEELLKFKGPPVSTVEERRCVLEACKWVDKCVLGPYEPSLEILDKHGIDFATRGEDIPVGIDGEDLWAPIRRAGRVKLIERTKGVSTSELIGRLISLNHLHHQKSLPPLTDLIRSFAQHPTPEKGCTTIRVFNQSTKKFEMFLEGREKPGKRFYMDGGFDLFHAGHVSTMRKVKEKSTEDQPIQLVVGLYSDSTINDGKGMSYPVMNLEERLLSVLSCKHVDEVILDVPTLLSDDFMKELNIDSVVHGSMGAPTAEWVKTPRKRTLDNDHLGPLATATKVLVISDFPELCSTELADRVIRNRTRYQQRQTENQLKNMQHDHSNTQ